jgi:hypothetical protein
MDAVSDHLHDTDRRGHFIPVRKSDILDALVHRNAIAGSQANEQFRQLCRMLGAIFHYEYFDRLERLRNDYYYFNPEHDGHPRYDAAEIELAYRNLLDDFADVLKGANFVEVSHAEIEHAHREHGAVRLDIKAPIDDYRDIKFYRRGRHRETIEISQLNGWRTRRIETDVYDDVVLLVVMKHENDAGPAEAKSRRRARRRQVRPGAVLIKYFRNIACADLNTLYPDVRVVMSLRDKLILGVPALLGGIPILIKLASTVTVLFLVAGFYLGIKSAVREDEMAGALAAVSGLVALGGFMVRQWSKFQRRSLLHQKQLADNIYFRNVNNNAGIFDYIIGAAEEQECKEAFLAYYFLLTSGEGRTEAELDRRIEQWLHQNFDVDIDFECDDALAKLDRLGLLRRRGSTLTVLPLDDALVCLDRRWDNYFQYAGAPARMAPT